MATRLPPCQGLSLARGRYDAQDDSGGGGLLTDPRPSHFGISATRSAKTGAWTSFFAIPEWVSDLSFYERLVDGREEELTMFRRDRILMEDEAEG
jgi:hypothetical protein